MSASKCNKGNTEALFVRLNIVLAPVSTQLKGGPSEREREREVLKRGVEHEGGTPLSYSGTSYCSI